MSIPLFPYCLIWMKNWKKTANWDKIREGRNDVPVAVWILGFCLESFALLIFYIVSEKSGKVSGSLSGLNANWKQNPEPHVW